MSWVSSVVDFAVDKVTDSLSATSQWGSLHPDLIAKIKPCNDQGTTTGIGIAAPLKDGSLEQTFRWQSPFENINPEAKHPTFMAAMQSGGIGQALQTMSLILADTKGAEAVSDEMASASETIKNFLDSAKGRTGITKMNSRQVFAGHEPLKIQATLLFRAFQNPQGEVVKPFWALMNMAYPTALADDYLSAFKAVKDSKDRKEQILHTLFPSLAPGQVSFTYKGETYKPMVIESIGKPLDAPYSFMGDLFLEVPITLASLRSLDGKDLANVRKTAFDSIISDAIAGVTSLF